MERSVDLVVNIIEGRTDAVSAFSDVEDGAAKMSRAVDDAGSTAERNGKRFSVSAEGADNLATKSSVATGALGALSSGFELVGLEKYATGLQQASLATDFFSGVGDSLTLVMESTRLANLKAAVTSRVATVATRAQTVAQRALNLVMRANPIGLIITAVTLLVGGIVLLYRRSETFRNIVQAVGRAGRAAFGFVVDRARDLVGWVRDRLPGGFATFQRLAVGYLRLVTTPIRTVIDVVRSLIGWVRDRLPAAFSAARDRAAAIGDRLLAPFRAVRDMIDSIIRAVGRIRIPKLPSFSNPFSSSSRVAGFSAARMAAPDDGAVMMMAAAPASRSFAASGSSSSGDVGGTVINVSGALDPDAVARQIERLLLRRGVRVGTA